MQCVFNGDIEYRTDDDDDAADDDDEIWEYLWLFGERNIDGKSTMQSTATPVVTMMMMPVCVNKIYNIYACLSVTNIRWQ